MKTLLCCFVISVAVFADIFDNFASSGHAVQEQCLGAEMTEDSINKGIDHYKSVVVCDPLVTVSWLTEISRPCYFPPLGKSLVNREDYFTDIEVMDRYHIWITPYGGYLKQADSACDIESSMLGFTVGGGLTFIENLTIGLAIGYWYANPNNQPPIHDAEIHSLNFGPYIGYTFQQGFVALQIPITYCSETFTAQFAFPCLDGELHVYSPEDHQKTGWNLGLRLQGGVDIPLGTTWFIRPTGRVGFFHAWQGDTEYLLRAQAVNEDTDPYDVHLTTNSYQVSIFQSCVSLDLRKEWLIKHRMFVIPAISLGYVYSLPFSSEHVSAQLETTYANVNIDHHIDVKKSLSTASQLSFETNLCFMTTSGWLMLLGYRTLPFGKYQTHVGKICLEWIW